MEQTSEFWVAVATILPVLGLALLLVARVQFRESVGSRWGMGLFVMTFMPPLVGMAPVEVVALAALLGFEPPDWWALLAMVIVVLTTVPLFISPALNMLFAVLPGAGVSVVNRSLRRVRREYGRRIRRNEKSLERILIFETSRLEQMAGAVWKAAGRGIPAGLPVGLLRARYEAEVRQLEMVAQEFAFIIADVEKMRSDTTKELKLLAADARKVNSLHAWGLFSGTIGQEGAAQAREEAAAILDQVREETRQRPAATLATPKPWANEQAEARWPGSASGQ